VHRTTPKGFVESLGKSIAGKRSSNKNPKVTGLSCSNRNFVVEGEKHPSQFADNDYRLATVALLVHAAGIDGDVSQRERDKLHAVVKRRFNLYDRLADELIDKATAAEHEAVDLYHFTKLLTRVLDEEGRAKFIEMMWEIVYADGLCDELEDNLPWQLFFQLFTMSGHLDRRIRRVATHGRWAPMISSSVVSQRGTISFVRFA
jgi:uncharacterized tellurite resistance protein B-like protein